MIERPQTAVPRQIQLPKRLLRKWAAALLGVALLGIAFNTTIQARDTRPNPEYDRRYPSLAPERLGLTDSEHIAVYTEAGAQAVIAIGLALAVWFGTQD